MQCEPGHSVLSVCCLAAACAERHLPRLHVGPNYWAARSACMHSWPRAMIWDCMSPGVQPRSCRLNEIVHSTTAAIAGSTARALLVAAWSPQTNHTRGARSAWSAAFQSGTACISRTGNQDRCQFASTQADSGLTTANRQNIDTMTVDDCLVRKRCCMQVWYNCCRTQVQDKYNAGQSGARVAVNI